MPIDNVVFGEEISYSIQRAHHPIINLSTLSTADWQIIILICIIGAISFISFILFNRKRNAIKLGGRNNATQENYIGS